MSELSIMTFKIILLYLILEMLIFQFFTFFAVVEVGIEVRSVVFYSTRVYLSQNSFLSRTVERAQQVSLRDLRDM